MPCINAMHIDLSLLGDSGSQVAVQAETISCHSSAAVIPQATKLDDSIKTRILNNHAKY